MYNLKAWIFEIIENLPCAVRRAIVDNNDLELASALSQGACDGIPHVGLTVIYRHQH